MDHRIARRPESHLSKIMTYVLFITSCLTTCYRQLIPFKRDENIWLYLAKNVVNISDFCLAGGTFVEQTFTTCLLRVCTSPRSLGNYTLFKHISKGITYPDIYNWEPLVTLKDREMLLLKVPSVAPAGECAPFVNSAKNCYVLCHRLLLHTTCPLMWICN